MLVELRIGARSRVAVRPPAVELRGVPEAPAFHVVVADFDDTLRAQGNKGHVLAGVPPRRLVPAGAVLPGRPVPRMLGDIGHQGLQIGEQLPALRQREGPDDAHRDQGVVVKTEEQ